MSRTTIDFGIDLGTTNSAIAVLNGVTSEIIKNVDYDTDITPSAVSIDKAGNSVYVGLPAKNRALDHFQDTYLEFKRRMGSDFVYQFKSSGLSRRPEELSAEVLKSLRSDAQQRLGELPDAAVITVPAVFELHQCDATRKAAQLAGFKESPLLMEPTAASLAYGFQREAPKAYWLVYDFGGGTFDAALMKAEDGTIQMVNHGGDNFLGGSDIDWALVEKVIVPRFLADYKLHEFDRAHSGVGQRWRQIFAIFKWVAESVKIQLSRRDKVIFEAKHLKEEGGNFSCDFFECEVTRDDLIRVAEPIIARSLKICDRVLKEKSLDKNAVERVILVGGPTLAPYFRDILTGSLSIPLDHSVDPLTVVARGAAIFAGTQRLATRASAAVTGEFSIDLKFKSVGPEDDPDIGGKVLGSGIQDFSGFTLELTNVKTLWKSGKITIRPNGAFVGSLHAEKGQRNTFSIELFDAGGRKQKTNPDSLVYTVGAVVDEQALTVSVGIALANNEYHKLFEKGRGLPLKASHDYRTVETIARAQTATFIKIPIVQGENELADRNTHIDDLLIGGNIRRELPAGSTVEVTLRIDESRIITALAYVPLLDQEFEAKIDIKKKSADPDFLWADFDAEMKRFHSVADGAATAGGETAARIVQTLEVSDLMRDVKESLASAKGDPDAAARCEGRLLELKLKLDEATDALELPALVIEAKDWLQYLQRVAIAHGDEKQKQLAADFAKEVEEMRRLEASERLRKKIVQIRQLYFEIVMAQAGWWVNEFQRVEKEQSKMSDQNRAARVLDQGRECIVKNNAVGLQNVVRQLWTMLPKDVAEAARRGFGAGLVK